MGIQEERETRTKWFIKDRFGMFIHWGLYAIPGRGEWVRSVERISREDYMQYFYEFDPVDYNPKAWAKAAREAGMKYAVMTAKHHDGFCLFDSALTDFKATKTKAGRDLIREYIDAFRAEGLKVGIYYSLIDWYHEDYPHYGDLHHPMRENESYRGREHHFERYLKYFHGQVKEICSNYGKIDILWFDFSYGDMAGEKWKAAELVQMVHELQPHVIIDNRLEAGGTHFGSIVNDNPCIYSGDFASPEQIIPPEGVTDLKGRSIPWEACVTMNNNWGYASEDKQFKTPKMLIRKLVECVSKNGNLLLNIGPDAKGNIPESSVKILADIGKWMNKNSRSIYGCGKAGLPKPEWGYYTQNQNMLYAHIFEGNIGPLPLTGVEGKIKKIRLLRDGSEIKPVLAWNTEVYKQYENYKHCCFINFGPQGYMTYPIPDDTDTVLEIELE